MPRSALTTSKLQKPSRTHITPLRAAVSRSISHRSDLFARRPTRKVMQPRFKVGRGLRTRRASTPARRGSAHGGQAVTPYLAALISRQLLPAHTRQRAGSATKDHLPTAISLGLGSTALRSDLPNVPDKSSPRSPCLGGRHLPDSGSNRHRSPATGPSCLPLSLRSI